jgi:ubiquinone/menaquinone biosynthesis C-methylase UbiE
VLSVLGCGWSAQIEHPPADSLSRERVEGVCIAALPVRRAGRFGDTLRMGARPDFDARAARYDAIRPQNAVWWRRFDALVEHGDLRGRRVLDVGCGTGALAAALAERAGARVWGVDPSERMLEVARSRVPRGVGLKPGHAEALPFKNGWFERVVMSLVVHLVDRRRAFAEARRVLTADGRLVIATFDHSHFDHYWAARFFPSLANVDRRRFPDGGRLRAELQGAGFRSVSEVPLPDVEVLERATALDRLRGRHISTFDLLDEDEIRAGIAQAERELPERVESPLEQLVVVAS